MPEIAPPVIVNVPYSHTNTPPPSSAVLPEIAPPVNVNVPFPPTRTPQQPPVMAPVSGTLLVSVRSPHSSTKMTQSSPLPVSVWPARSSVTAVVMVRHQSSSPAS